MRVRGEIKMSKWTMTTWAFIAMLVYGWFAIQSDTLSFNYILAAGIILFCLFVEATIVIIDHITRVRHR